jgi:HK97 family phage portal protein
VGRSFLGKLLNQGAPVPMAPTARGLRYSLTGGRTGMETYLRAYSKMGTLWSTVSLLASSTARPEWRLYQKATDNRRRYSTTDIGSDQRTEVLQHAALSVLKDPNDFWTRFELFEQYQQYLDLTGLAYMLVGYDDRVNFPTELWPVRPDRIEPVPSTTDYLQGYIYHGPNGELVPLDLNEIVPIRYPDPMDPYGGVGPVQSVLTDIDAAQYSAEWNRNYFYNGAEPGGVITAPSKMSDPDWDEFTDRWRESHRGISRAHAVAVLEGGMQWVPNATSQKDMDFANLRSMSRDIVREAYGMHKVMLGVTEDVNRANAQTGEEVFYSWKVIPRLDRWKMVLNERYLPLFGSTGKGVEFDYVAPAPQNREQDNEELTAKATAVQMLVAAGFDPHDACEVVGLPDMKFAAPAQPAKPSPPPGEADETVSGDTAPTVDTGQDMANLLRRVLSDGYQPVVTGRR